jgi:hypothetical protein
MEAQHDLSAPTQAEAIKEKKWWEKPIFLIAAGIASIIALPLSVYLYWASISTPELTVYVAQIQSVVAQPKLSHAIQLSCKGREITNDVFIRQFAIWNAGRKEIRRDDILAALKLKAGTNIVFLDAQVSEQKREISEVRLDKADISKGEIGINWRIFEKNDGAVIQVIYEGAKDSPVMLEGTIVGQQGIKYLVQTEKYKTNTDKFLEVIFILMTISTSILMWLEYAKNKRLIDKIFSLITGCSAVVLIILQVLSFFKTKPPFNF